MHVLGELYVVPTVLVVHARARGWGGVANTHIMCWLCTWLGWSGYSLNVAQGYSLVPRPSSLPSRVSFSPHRKDREEGLGTRLAQGSP